jgi:hypothetical protein
MAVVPTEGTTIGYGTVQAGPFTGVAQVLTVDMPDIDVTKVPTTTLASTFKQYRPGKMPELNECSITIQYDPNDTGHKLLRDDAQVPGTLRWFKVTYADTFTTKANDVFQGFVSQFAQSEAEEENNQEATITLCLTSIPVRTQGS